MKKYRIILGRNMFKPNKEKFWDFHKRGLRFAGYNLSRSELALCALSAMLDRLLDPSALVRALARRVRG